MYMFFSLVGTPFFCLTERCLNCQSVMKPIISVMYDIEVNSTCLLHLSTILNRAPHTPIQGLSRFCIMTYTIFMITKTTSTKCLNFLTLCSNDKGLIRYIQKTVRHR